MVPAVAWVRSDMLAVSDHGLVPVRAASATVAASVPDRVSVLSAELMITGAVTVTARLPMEPAVIVAVTAEDPPVPSAIAPAPAAGASTNAPARAAPTNFLL